MALRRDIGSLSDLSAGRGVVGGVYDVRGWGAKTSLADNLAKLNDASAAIASAGGGRLFVPGGTWFVAPSGTTTWLKLYDRVGLLLAPDATIKVPDGVGNFQTLIGAPTEGAAVSDVSVEGGKIDLNPNGNGGTIANVAGQVQNAVRFTNFDGVTIKGVRVNKACGQNTVMLAGNGCKNAWVLDNFVHFSARGTPGYDNSAIYVECVGKTVRGNRGFAELAALARGFIELHNGASTASDNECDGFETLYNVVSGAYADKLADGGWEISGGGARNALKAVTLWVIAGSPMRNVSIRGVKGHINHVTRNQSQSWGVGTDISIASTDGIENLTIEGCPIEFETGNPAVAVSGYYSCGIWVGNRGPITGLAIHGNPVKNAPGAGIRVGETGYASNPVTAFDVSGNPLIDCGRCTTIADTFRTGLYLDGSLKNGRAHHNPIHDTGPSAMNGKYAERANFTMDTVTDVAIYENPKTTTSGSFLGATIDRSKVADYTGSAALDFGSIAAGAEASLTMTVLGAQTTDTAYANPNADLETGLVVKQVRVSAADTVSIRLLNTTAGAIDPASRTWLAGIVKRTV